MDNAEEHSEISTRFRPSKKRKVFRQRTVDDEPGIPKNEAFESLETGESGDEDNASAVAAALRNRNARKARHGMGFASGMRVSQVASSDQALILRQPDAADEDDDTMLMGISDRFAHQTGTRNDLYDRHMYVSSWDTSNPRGFSGPLANQSRNEFIESRLNDRKAVSANPNLPNHRSTSQAVSEATAVGGAQKLQGLQPASRGRLIEVALDEVSRHSRPAATVPQSLQHPSHQQDDKYQRPAKDTKPRRNRNRRGSDDIARDKFVEEFLSENKRT